MTKSLTRTSYLGKYWYSLIGTCSWPKIVSRVPWWCLGCYELVDMVGHTRWDSNIDNSIGYGGRSKQWISVFKEQRFTQQYECNFFGTVVERGENIGEDIGVTALRVVSFESFTQSRLRCNFKAANTRSFSTST
jgi:hypothetical protein